MVKRRSLPISAIAGIPGFATVAVVVAGVASIGCKPDIEGRPSLVDSDRVLAISSDRPEATPGDSVTYTALYVGAKGAADPSNLGWAFCNVQKPLVVTGPIAPECLAPRARGLVPLQNGATATSKVPIDACKVFGPFPPDHKPGQPPGRPADPDTTGGYYQPVRVLVPTDTDPDYSVGVTRLICGLSGATQEQSSDYVARYRPNENPALDSLVLTRANGKTETLSPVTADAPSTPTSVRPGETVTFRASWATCPTKPVCGDGICGPTEVATDCKSGVTVCCPDDCSVNASLGTPKGCTGSEPYVSLDPVLHAIVRRRESMRVSWFTTDGDYAFERTGVAEDDPAPHPYSDDQWTAPASAGKVSIWVVLRDDRGGVGFTAHEVDVQP